MVLFIRDQGNHKKKNTKKDNVPGTWCFYIFWNSETHRKLRNHKIQIKIRSINNITGDHSGTHKNLYIYRFLLTVFWSYLLWPRNSTVAPRCEKCIRTYLIPGQSRQNIHNSPAPSYAEISGRYVFMAVGIRRPVSSR